MIGTTQPVIGQSQPLLGELPVLVIVVPILGAVLAMLGGLVHARAGRAVANLAAVVHLAVAAALGWHVADGGEALSYAVGGFELPYGIELVVDGLSAVLVVTIAVTFVGTVVYARRAGPHSTAFYSLLCLLVAGLTGMTVTGDVFNLYVFLEIAGLAAYALIASGDDADAAVAGLKYLLVGTVGASLYLLGVGLLLITTGTLNMAHIRELLGTPAAVEASAASAPIAAYTSPTVLAAFGLIAGGLIVKTALFPVHTWQPDAYATSPASVATVVSALVSTVAAYALGRVILSVFTVEFFEAVPAARTAVLAVAAVSVVAGSVLAVLQTDLRRMLAYSSVSQFGMVVAAFAVATPIAVVGGLIHLVGHAIMKGGLFATAGLVAKRTGAETIDEYAGLHRRAPVGAGAFAVLALAMIGVPPAVGFVGKFYIVLGAANQGAWVIVGVILVSTLLTLAYFATVIERMYFAGGDAAGTGATVAGTDAAEHAAVSGPGAETTPATDGNGTPAGTETLDATGTPAGTETLDATGTPAGTTSRRVSVGMILVVVGAAVAAVALGLLASGIQPLVEGTLQGVLAPP